MPSQKVKLKNNRALRFYYEVLGMERLHYGLWTQDDPRTLEGAKKAQKRYEDFLFNEIEQLAVAPAQTRVLDVGCGSGVMSQTLYENNYQVEGLSPDLYQKEVFEKRIPVPFHLARFQNFEPGEKYDIVLMSESAQYIPVKKLFANAANCLKTKGHLMVCDYFVFNDASGLMAKSGHNLELFLKSASDQGFYLAKKQDITRETIPTLDAAKIFVNQYIIPSLDIVSEKLAYRHPFLYKTARWFFRKKIEKARQKMILLDSKEFAKNKCYMFLLFEKM
ncbi:MAG: class I SAM-dependent methyltransferase [Bacteroidota bacterium]